MKSRSALLDHLAIMMRLQTFMEQRFPSPALVWPYGIPVGNYICSKFSLVFPADRVTPLSHSLGCICCTWQSEPWPLPSPVRGSGVSLGPPGPLYTSLRLYVRKLAMRLRRVVLLVWRLMLIKCSMVCHYLVKEQLQHEHLLRPCSWCNHWGSKLRIRRQ